MQQFGEPLVQIGSVAGNVQVCLKLPGQHPPHSNAVIPL